jgi:predicted SnoaL-like aldol condensation-catalyzing enzyme
MEYYATLFSVSMIMHRSEANSGRKGYVSFFIIHHQGKPRQELKARIIMEESCLLS